jgi:hypothetical protein
MKYAFITPQEDEELLELIDTPIIEESTIIEQDEEYSTNNGANFLSRVRKLIRLFRDSPENRRFLQNELYIKGPTSLIIGRFNLLIY